MSAVLEAREPSARYLPSAQTVLVRQFGLLATAPGGVARLRNLIVSLAVRGGLSQREPTDATLAPDVTYDGDAPYELPKGWRWQRLGELQPEFQNGAASRGDAGGQPITVLRLADIRNRRVSLAATRTVPIRREDIERYLLRDGDILITRVNGSADIVGQFNLVEGEPRAIYCDHFIRLRVNRQVIEPHYLALFASCDMVRKRTGDLFISTAGQKTVNQGHIASLPIAIPPLRDQARIVARVDELMQLCDALEAKGQLEAQQHARLLETLLGTLTESTTPEELAANWQRVAEHFDLLLDRPEAVDALEQTVLQLATSGRFSSRVPHVQTASVELADQGSAALPFSVPADWSWVSLGQLTSLVTSGSRSWKDYYSDEGATFIRSQDIKYDRLEFDNRAYVRIPPSAEGVRTQVRPRDVLITITGANVGKAAVVEEPLSEAYVSQHVALVRLLDPRIADYLHLWLVNEHGGRLRLLGSSYGAKPGLNLQNIKDLPVPLPPLEEQVRIVARVAELRRLCADLRQRLASSQATQSRLAGALVESVASA